MSVRYVYGEDDRLVAWAEERAASRFREDAVAIGLERDGTIRAAIVYDTFTTTGCFVHIASDGTRRWMTRELITRVFAYPFVQCGYPRISSLVSELNADTLRFTHHFGWREEGRMREAGESGEDLVLFGMLRRECRFLPKTIAASGLMRRVAV